VHAFDGESHRPLTEMQEQMKPLIEIPRPVSDDTAEKVG
jgi:hypothetical protein